MNEERQPDPSSEYEVTPEFDSQTSRGSNNKVLKWIGCGCLVLLILGGLGAGGCWYAFNLGKKEESRKMCDRLSSAVADRADADSFETRIEALRQLNEDGDLGFMAFGVFVNLTNSMARDGKIDDQEAQRLDQFLNDVIEKKGSFSIEFITENYPEGGQ